MIRISYEHFGLHKVAEADTGLTARIIVSFGILAFLYIVFLGVLVYVGLDFVSITLIASIMILAQWDFSDRIVLWSS